MSDRVTPPSGGALADRVPVAGGAMGTMLRSAARTPDDVAGHGGRSETVHLIGPDVRTRCAAAASEQARTP